MASGDGPRSADFAGSDRTNVHPIDRWRPAARSAPPVAPAAKDPSLAASLAIAAAGAIVAYVVVSRPPLRRAAWRVLKYGVGTMLPRYLRDEVVSAWASTANRRGPEIMTG